MRELQRALSVAVRAGEAAADVAEELGLEERVSERGAVDRDQRSAPAAAVGVNEPGDDFLADSAFTGDENLRVASRRIRDFFVESANGGCFAKQRVEFHRDE